jgi:ATP-binding cassette subfamily A (ABC1) protein 3
MQTGVQVPTPLEWPFSQETNEEQATSMRLSTYCLSGICLFAHLTPSAGYIRGIRELLVIAL